MLSFNKKIPFDQYRRVKMSRRKISIVFMFVLVLLVSIFFCSGVVLQPTDGMQATAPSVTGDQMTLLRNGLARIGAAPDLTSQTITQFNSLPPDLQNTIIERVTSGPVTRPISNISRAALNEAIIAGSSPAITEVWPEKAGWNEWVQIKGDRFTNNCVAQWDGLSVPSTIATGAVWFKVPSKDVGSNHKISVYDKSTALASLPANFIVISPRTYRSKWGWQFKNFTTSEISYNIFRDYFTPAQVEYAPGKPYSGAQYWYNTTYRWVGMGGDCFGMSVRSIRTRKKDYSGTWSSWLSSNVKPTVYEYPWIDPYRADGIREDQGAQLSREAAYLIDDRWHHQNHSQAVNMVWSALSSGDISKMPILCMWKDGHYGHAAVCYSIGYANNEYKLWLYDNNKPYSEMEKNWEESTATVNGNGNFFYSYWPGTVANRMICLLYSEIAIPLPTLPFEVGNTTGMGSDTTIAVFDNASAVQQITDEAGRTFFAGGAVNTSSSQIPDAMRFVPMGGGPISPNAPAIFIFNHTTGKSLTFDTQGTAPGFARIFSAGSVTSVSLASGKFILRNMLYPSQELELVAPEKMGLQNVEIISVQPDRSERVFQMNSFKNLVPGSLKFSLSSAQNSIMASGVPAQFALSLQNQSAAGLRTAAMPNVAIQAGRMTSVSVPDFRSLQDSSIRMEQR
jgi:hypothetical protein